MRTGEEAAAVHPVAAGGGAVSTDAPPDVPPTTPPRSDEGVIVSAPAGLAETVGAILADELGSYEEIDVPSGRRELVFFPSMPPSDADVNALLSAGGLSADVLTMRGAGAIRIYRETVLGGWEESWREHFRPFTVGSVYVRPPWEPPPTASGATGPVFAGGDHERGTAQGVALRDGALDVVIDPGLAFGTGLHATTRGVLELLQEGGSAPGVECGPLLDAGCGTGILSIAAVRLGYGSVLAFDNDPLAVEAAHKNVERNGVAVDVRAAEVAVFPAEWLYESTVLANIALLPALELLERIDAGARAPRTGVARGGATGAAPRGARAPELLPRRVIVSGILAGKQESQLVVSAKVHGFRTGHLKREGEWVTIELVPETEV